MPEVRKVIAIPNRRVTLLHRIGQEVEEGQKRHNGAEGQLKCGRVVGVKPARPLLYPPFNVVTGANARRAHRQIPSVVVRIEKPQPLPSHYKDEVDTVEGGVKPPPQLIRVRVVLAHRLLD